jgi:iron complex transport system substrate-binding protein
MRRTLSLLAAAFLIFALAPAVQAALVTADREGTPITLPDSIERIASFGASNTEILCALGAADKLIAIDAYSENVEGIPEGLDIFDMLAPDAERIMQLQPDLILVTVMSRRGGEDDPYATVKDAGICVIYMPTSNTIEDIKGDILYVASVLGADNAGAAVVSWMDENIAAVKAIGDAVTDKKGVYFEISAAPFMYSFGSGAFLNEIIEMIGAYNVMGGRDSWISVTDEAALAANPDVILTSVDYIEDPVGEIKGRPSWDAVTAVKNDRVYYIDADASNRPSQNIIKAMWDMAIAVYPDLYAEAYDAR